MGISVELAGKMGGLALLNKRGRDHFSDIGRKGQRVMRSKYPHMAAKWGKLGGRPKKLSLEDVGK